MKKKFAKKLTLECPDDDLPEDQFLQTNFTKLDAECVQFLKEDISVSARGMIHKSKTSRSFDKSEIHSRNNSHYRNNSIYQQIDSNNTKIKEEQNSVIVKRDICKQDQKFLEVIGKGASGLVYRAILQSEDIQVAVKSINIYDRDMRHQLINDLHAFTNHKLCFKGGKSREFSCPFLVDFWGAYLDETTVKVVLEYMDRGSLQNIINIVKAKNLKVPEEIMAMLTLQMLNGLAYLHSVAGQVHLDIKPENILYNSKGMVKLTDFGISRDFEQSQEFMKTVVGTISYMSPERLAAQKYNAKSDIWSLGITVIEVATGEYPLEKSRSYVQLYQFLKTTEKFGQPESFDATEEFRDFCFLATMKDPALRPTAAELMSHPWIMNNQQKEVDQIGWLDSLTE